MSAVPLSKYAIHLRPADNIAVAAKLIPGVELRAGNLAVESPRTSAALRRKGPVDFAGVELEPNNRSPGIGRCRDPSMLMGDSGVGRGAVLVVMVMVFGHGRLPSGPRRVVASLDRWCARSGSRTTTWRPSPRSFAIRSGAGVIGRAPPTLRHFGW